MLNGTRCVFRILSITPGEDDWTTRARHTVPLDYYRYPTRRERIVPDENKQVWFVEPPADLETGVCRSSLYRLAPSYDGQNRYLRFPWEIVLREKKLLLLWLCHLPGNNVKHQRRTKRGRLPSLKVLRREKKHTIMREGNMGDIDCARTSRKVYPRR